MGGRRKVPTSPGLWGFRVKVQELPVGYLGLRVLAVWAQDFGVPGEGFRVFRV